MSDSRLLRAPPLEPYSPPLTIGPGEAVLIAAGFEDRARALLHDISGDGGACLIVDYRPEREDNFLESFVEAAEKRGLASKVLTYHRFEPDRFPERLRDALLDLEVRSLLIDISALSKLAIMLSLEVCRQSGLVTRVHYAEAKEYGPSKEEFEMARDSGKIMMPTLQVYSGVHGVVRVPQLSSVGMQGQPTAAVAFMSLNEQLTQSLINTVYPSRLFLVNGRPPQLTWREEATAWIHRELRLDWPAADNSASSSFESGEPRPDRVSSTLDYRETTSLLLDLYWHLSPRYRVLLAPTGSKMQAVGAYLVRALHPDVHVEYPTPDGFLPVYSSGVGRRWTLAFGDIRTLVEKLREEEKATKVSFSLN